MKKLIFYFVFVIILIFTMPIIFTNQFKTEEVISPKVEEKFDYGQYSTIKLLHTSTGVVEEMHLDEYLYGVVASEMPATFELEALKAQAVVARTYTIYKITWEEGKQEEYWNKIVEAVNSTKGKFILYNGEPINALFHSNSGGTTELSINVWGGEFPYFKTVETSGEENYTSYSSEVIVSKDELISKMLEKYSEFKIDFSSNNQIEILERTNSNRVSKLKIGNIEISGVEARSIFGLKSAKFNVEILDDNIKFSVLGYGHGVGFSQCGSDTLAKNGKNYEEIIKYYYKDIEISE